MAQLHRPIQEKVLDALEAIFAHKIHADKVIERTLKTERKWGARDRRIFAETVYELVRFWRRYWVFSGLPPQNFLASEFLIRANFQIVLQEYLEPKRIGSVDTVAVRESVSDEFMEWGQGIWHENWPQILSALNTPAKVYLRVNTLKTSLLQCQRDLDKEGIHTELVENLPCGLVLTERKNLALTKAFHLGHFEVQDGASQSISPFLQVEPGQRVIDACAGAGGKTLHLAALMKNKGRIIALEPQANKVEELRKRLRRAGVQIVDARIIEGSKTIKRLHQSADRLLLDVPCTGVGVLRRNPDAKWKLTAEHKKEVLRTQREILLNYSHMVKKGGKMVYATCSIDPDENQEQVRHFLRENSQWKLDGELNFLPHVQGFDGFYAACLSIGD